MDKDGTSTVNLLVAVVVVVVVVVVRGGGGRGGGGGVRVVLVGLVEFVLSLKGYYYYY